MDEVQNKPWYKSKSVWAAISLFLVSTLATVGELPIVTSNPKATGIIGVVYAVAWVLLRIITDTPISISSLPNPIDWLKGKK